MNATTSFDLSAFFSRQRELLENERQAEIERSALLLSNCGPKLLEQKGLALIGLGVVDVKVGLGGKTLVELHRLAAYHTNSIFPPHMLRPGDLARIEENGTARDSSKMSAAKIKKSLSATENPTSSELNGVVYKVSDSRIVIAIDSTDDLDLPERCRIVKLVNSVTYDRMDKTMDVVEKIASSGSAVGSAPVVSSVSSGRETTRLVEVLLGISNRSSPMPVSNLVFFDESLNESQKDAVRFALESPEVACLHGPPGTGKTHTLIEIIRQLTASDLNDLAPSRKILVCGASNLSVDNILERLLSLPRPAVNKDAAMKVTRVGHPARVMALQDVLDATLDARASRTEQAALAKDVKDELEALMKTLSGKGKGGGKNKPPKGLARKKLWEEVKALRKEYRQREGGVVRSVLSESQVILATCHSAGSKVLRDQVFDVVIIDEATQALEAVCWIPILKAKKVILAGDPMQLPPTILAIDRIKNDVTTAKSDCKRSRHLDSVDNPGDFGTSKIAVDQDRKSSALRSRTSSSNNISLTSKRLRPPHTLETTLFERLEYMYGPNIKRVLKVQYRMHQKICQFPSLVLYDSILESHHSIACHVLEDLPGRAVTDAEEEKDVLAHPVVFFDTAGCEFYERLDGDNDEGSRCNENEATVVVDWVAKLIACGLQVAQIAIITPYQAQVTLLTSLLRPLYGPELEIGSVDGMQGREKETVILSLVRSNSKREVGFLKEKRRLNVAMTRAKRQLCVVGDSSTVRHGSPYLDKWMHWLELNADLRYAGGQ